MIVRIIKSNFNNPVMKKMYFITSAIVLLLFETHDILGQRSWSFNISLGDAYCFKMPLVIEQEGYEEIKLTAHYKTESFKLPVYYSWKIETVRDKKGWELELTHLKIILSNKPSEVQEFRVSHGYNYLTVNRIWDLDFLIFRFGMGTIVAHPESTVRNMSFDTHQGFLNRGYHFSGLGMQIAAEKRITIYRGFFFSLEVKAAVAWAKVGIAEGYAIVPQAGFHGLFGIGYIFK
jgi:hypothetical protein